MIWQALPPVRRPVPLWFDRSIDADAQWAEYFPGRSVIGYGSGTQALQAAIEDCLYRLPGRRKVAIPAYGCPDLVTACMGAGAEPVLVDVYPDRWGYDLEALEKTLDDGFAAIVAVNLLGLGDNADVLRRFADKHGARLIQDSAQSLPRTPPKWVGDYVVLSFGRGKPLNLLGGGLLASSLGTKEPLQNERPADTGNRLTWFLRASLFNVATDRRLLPWVYRLTGYRTGGTRYRAPVPTVESPAVTRVAGCCLPGYRATPSYSIARYAPLLGRWKSLGIRRLCVANAPGQEAPMELLRLPLIAASQDGRDRMLVDLNGYGLGVTSLYQVSLPDIRDVPSGISAQGPFPGARSLATRLLTLPTHAQVDGHPSFQKVSEIQPR